MINRDATAAQEGDLPPACDYRYLDWAAAYKEDVDRVNHFNSFKHGTRLVPARVNVSDGSESENR